MSATYKAVSWTRSKMIYDAVMIASVVVYLLLFFRLGAVPGRDGIAPDAQTLAMKAFGSCAFLMLSAVLAIGPLARLDVRFLPLLYNRRHLGVLTCVIAVAHASAVLEWYYAYSSVPPLKALLSTDTASAQVSGFAFVGLGVAALLILLVLAATSHDFWLAFLGPGLWKSIHMLAYAAYALVVGHVAFGALQDARPSTWDAVVLASVSSLVALHGLSAWRGLSSERAPNAAADGWLVAGTLDTFTDGRGVTIAVPDGEPVAVFRDGARLGAVSNVCAHQNGPLGEGRVIDGCVTCPWHGFQYRLVDGCAPAPFTERIATYRLAREGGTILLDPKPFPPGTPVDPLVIAEWQS